MDKDLTIILGVTLGSAPEDLNVRQMFKDRLIELGIDAVVGDEQLYTITFKNRHDMNLFVISSTEELSCNKDSKTPGMVQGYRGYRWKN